MPILGLLFTCFTGGGFRAHTYANSTHSVTLPGQLQMAIQLSECMNSLRTIAVFNERVEARALTGSLLQTR